MRKLLSVSWVLSGLCVLAAEVRQPTGAAVDAAAFGLSCAAADNVSALNRALDWCRTNGAARLTVAPGTYRFTSDTPIRLENLKDFTFDGGGAKFVFHRREGESFCVTGCVRTAIRNLSVDWDWEKDPLGSLVKVVEADGTHLDLEFVDYARFPRRDVRLAYLSAWDSAARAVGVPGLTRLGRGIDMAWGSEVRQDPRREWLSDNVLRVYKGAANLPTGTVWRVQHYYYDLNCFRLFSNVGLAVEDVNVLSCPGFAFLIDGKQRDTLFRRVTIRPPADDPKRVISCTADHVHVARSNGNLRLEDCDFSLGADDGINVHDVTAWAPEAHGADALVVRNGAGAFDVGDAVAIRNADYSPCADGEFRVVRKEPVAGNPRGAVVTFDRPVPPKTHKYGFVLFNRSYCSDGVVMRNCTFGGNRARGVIIQCNDVLIENCRFWHTESEALKITTGWTEDLWCEGVGVTNCVVRNCTFDSCQAGAEGKKRDEIIFLSTYLRQPSYARGWESSAYPVFDRIRFENNTFVGCGKYPARDSSWGSVTFAEGADEPVDVFVGTAGLGHVSPAACAPFGLVQAGPDTSASSEKYVGDWAHTSGYQHGDGWIWRFSQTRLSGTGCPSGGDFGLLPFTGERPAPARKVAASEKGRPGFYAVELDGGLSCAVAAVPHGAVYRFAYPKGASAKLLVDADWTIARRGKDDGRLWGVFATYVKESEIRALSPTRLVARRKVRAWVDYEIFCALDFSRPIVSRDGGVCDFGAAADGPLEVRLALSLTSADAAVANLEAELAGRPLESVAAQTAAAWDAYLSRVRLAPGTDPAVRTSLRAALYRTAIQPNDIGDVGREEYSTFSLWDTFRAAHPLYTLLAPERVNGFVRSLLKVYERNGYLPIWGLWGTDTHCMIGHHAVPVIVDAYLKGFRDYDVGLAWRAVRDSLTRTHKAVSDSTWGQLKEDWPLLERYGYLPYDALTGGSRGHKVVGESVSRLFEGAYDDACAARFAAALGKADDAAFFARRSGYWRNALDPVTKFARGRDAAGAWREPFDPKACGHCWFQANDFTEGNAMQYTWHVLHDPDGLVVALGGRDAALARLQRLFSGESVAYGENGVSDVTGLIGQYAHGNEPSHHIIYFFSLLGRPDLAAKYVKEVFDTQYRPTPDGLCGNDDCGQMSAWYVFSALGFCPFDPCGGDYVVGAPQVPGAELSLPGGKTLTVRTENFAPGAAVEKVVLNGREIADSRLRHADLVKGGELVYRMKRLRGE